MRILASAALLAAIAAPASAVSVISIDAAADNNVTVWTAEAGLLEADASIAEFSPITITLARSAGEQSFAFNSFVDFLTGVRLGKTVGTLDISLAGATFTDIGSIESAFSSAQWTLSEDQRVLSIRFIPGEGYGAQLGIDTPFAITFDEGMAGASLTLLASAVPEPATWALLVGGFGVMGVSLRRRKWSRTLA